MMSMKTNTMNLRPTISMSLCVLAAVALHADPAANWHQWRGPEGSGFAPEANPPLEWSESQNVKWKVELPGSGASTPIIWNDKVFILTAVPTGETVETGESTDDGDQGNRRRRQAPQEIQQFAVVCLDRNTGKVLWNKVAREQLPHEGHHRDHGFASASPVTDGEHLFAFFGSRGLYAFDMEGNLKWEVDFGDMNTRNSFGEGTSPALYEDTLVVVWDHEGNDDFVVAVDKSNGKELWRTARSEGTSWTTPVFAEVNGKPQVIVAGATAVIGYDLKTGEEVWRGPGLTANVVPTPIVDDGVVYAMSGFRGAALQAIKLGATGNLDGTDAILWSYNRNTPYVPSGTLVDEYLYFSSGNNSILTCLDARTGNAHFAEERLEGLSGIYSSFVATDDHVFVLGRNGACLVLEKGPELKIVQSNTLDDEITASMALAGDEVFIRGNKYLYCIAKN